MKRWLVLLLYCLPALLTAQPFQIEGSVIDGVSKKLLADAHIFIDQSFKATRSDTLGRFALNDIKVKTFEVVVAARGYQAITYKTTPDRANISIRFELLPVTDTAFDQIAWRRWGPVFKNNFLGITDNADQCEFLNPEVLRFSYNDSIGELTVHATDVLQVINDGLGYLVNYQLEAFKINQAKQWLEVSGYSYFKNLTTKRPEVIAKWTQKRKEAFEGSLMHFMRSMYLNNLEQQGFEFHILQRVLEGEPLFKTYKKQKEYTVFNTGKIVNNGSIVNYVFLLDNRVFPSQMFRLFDEENKMCFLEPKDLMQVVYKREKESTKYLLYKPKTNAPTGAQLSYLQAGRRIKVEPNGTFSERQDLSVGGYMSWEKVAEMLPVEYQPGL